MKFPSLEGEQAFNNDNVCPYCGQTRSMTDFAGIEVNAINFDRNVKGQATNHLYVNFFNHRGEPHSVSVVDLIQTRNKLVAELYFCNTDCLRAYLNAAVDKIEQQP